MIPYDETRGTPCHEHSIVVDGRDIDGLGHVNNVVYLRWVQDAAEAHWRSVATDEQQASLAWVVLRHEIEYLNPARAGDRIMARTWVASWKGATSDRRVDVVREGDGAVLARAVTRYCSVDPVGHKPRRADRETRTALLPEGSPPPRELAGTHPVS